MDCGLLSGVQWRSVAFNGENKKRNSGSSGSAFEKLSAGRRALDPCGSLLTFHTKLTHLCEQETPSEISYYMAVRIAREGMLAHACML